MEMGSPLIDVESECDICLVLINGSMSVKHA